MELDCKQVARLLSDAQDKDLAPAERTRMHLHLAICESCRNVNEQMEFLRQAIRQLGQVD